MLEKFKEFRDTLSERVRSPFIGSFIITWSLVHWKIYALFLFSQESITISERIGLIESYLAEKTFSQLFIYPALITLGLLLAYSVLNAIGLAIKLGYDNWASPAIQNILNNNNIVQKPKYDRVKRENALLKKNYEVDKEKLLETERATKNTEQSFLDFQKRSYEGQLINDITHVMSKQTNWENLHIYPDGRTGREIFHCDIDGFHLKDGKNIKIENIKIAQNGKILTFDKIFDEKIVSNYLIRDHENNYHGVENGDTKISYRKKKSDSIIINSAKYKYENNFIDVKPIIQNLVDNNIIKFVISNETMGGDPGHANPKTFEMDYIINNVAHHISMNEGQTFEFSF